MNTEVFITCAITGGGDTVGRHPAIPVTPKEIAAATLEATRAGAAIVHVHVRDPENGNPSRDPDLFVEVVDRIRSCGEDVVLNLTGGMGGDFVLGDIDEDPMIGGKQGSDLVGPDERLVHVEKLRPDICSLDCGTMNFGDGNLIYVNSPLYLRRMAALLKSWNVKPELEVFDLGQLRFACQMLKEGLLLEPPIFQLCLGIPWGANADTHSMVAMADRLPEGSVWSAFGISRAQMPMVAQSVLLGGNVRVGLEDNLYLEKGVFASNGHLVERAVEIIERLGARVIGPEEARRKLGLVAS